MRLFIYFFKAILFQTRFFILACFFYCFFPSCVYFASLTCSICICQSVFCTLSCSNIPTRCLLHSSPCLCMSRSPAPSTPYPSLFLPWFFTLSLPYSLPLTLHSVSFFSLCHASVSSFYVLSASIFSLTYCLFATHLFLGTFFYLCLW